MSLELLKPFPDCAQMWNEIVLPKLRSGQRTNVYFPSNTSSLHYFFLFQLWFLSKLAKTGNVFFYISLNDQVGSLKAESAERAKKGAKADPQIFMETKQILVHFGVKPENIFEYGASDTWSRLFNSDRNALFQLLKAIRAVPQKAFIIPKENAEQEYLEKGAAYPLSYALPKFMDILAANSFERLFSEDCGGKIDIFVTSGFGRALISKARSCFIGEGLISPSSPVFVSIPTIPFFGHNKKVFKRHIVPNAGMGLEEIYEAILLYKVKPEHIKILLNLGPLNSRLKAEEKSQKRLALALAKSLFEFFGEINSALGKEKQPMPLAVNGRETLESLSELFRSKIAMQTLKECDGKTVTEIAKKLDKQQPNISKAVALLKKTGLVGVDEKGRIRRKINVLKIELDRL